MTEKKKENILISLEEISEFKLDEKEFNYWNNKLDEKLHFYTVLYKDEEHKYKKYKGKIKNGKYHDRGILYDYGKIEYNGFFRNGKKEGFGQYFHSDYSLIGFFTNDQFINGIIKYKNIKKFECILKNDKESFIGIEFLENGNIKRKMEYKYKYYNFFPMIPKKNHMEFYMMIIII